MRIAPRESAPAPSCALVRESRYALARAGRRRDRHAVAASGPRRRRLLRGARFGGRRHGERVRVVGQPPLRRRHGPARPSRFRRPVTSACAPPSSAARVRGATTRPDAGTAHVRALRRARTRASVADYRAGPGDVSRPEPSSAGRPHSCSRFGEATSGALRATDAAGSEWELVGDAEAHARHDAAGRRARLRRLTPGGERPSRSAGRRAGAVRGLGGRLRDLRERRRGGARSTPARSLGSTSHVRTGRPAHVRRWRRSTRLGNVGATPTRGLAGPSRVADPLTLQAGEGDGDAPGPPPAGGRAALSQEGA